MLGLMEQGQGDEAVRSEQLQRHVTPAPAAQNPTQRTLCRLGQGMWN